MDRHELKKSFNKTIQRILVQLTGNRVLNACAAPRTHDGFAGLAAGVTDFEEASVAI